MVEQSTVPRLPYQVNSGWGWGWGRNTCKEASLHGATMSQFLNFLFAKCTENEGHIPCLSSLQWKCFIDLLHDEMISPIWKYLSIWESICKSYIVGGFFEIKEPFWLFCQDRWTEFKAFVISHPEELWLTYTIASKEWKCHHRLYLTTNQTSKLESQRNTAGNQNTQRKGGRRLRRRKSKSPLKRQTF